MKESKAPSPTAFVSYLQHLSSTPTKTFLSYALSLLHVILSDYNLSEVQTRTGNTHELDQVGHLIGFNYISCKERKGGNSDEFFLPLLFH
jgi:hypothetical protein